MLLRWLPNNQLKLETTEMYAQYSQFINKLFVLTDVFDLQTAMTASFSRYNQVTKKWEQIEDESAGLICRREDNGYMFECYIPPSVFENQGQVGVSLSATVATPYKDMDGETVYQNFTSGVVKFYVDPSIKNLGAKVPGGDATEILLSLQRIESEAVLIEKTTAKAITLDEDAEATAQVVKETNDRGELTGYMQFLIGIPRGTDGKDGVDGSSISSIEKVETNGLVDTYAITLTNGIVQTFTVTNGSKGDKGEDGKNPPVYTLVGRISTNKSGDCSLTIYKDGVQCEETLYLRTQRQSGDGTWQEFSNGSGSVKGSKNWTFSGDDGGIAFYCRLYTDSSRETLLASTTMTAGATGVAGANGADGKDGVDGEKGDKGERGDPFEIVKTYKSIGEMDANFATDEVPVGRFVIISTDNVEDPDNAKMFIKTDTKYSFVTDLSGAQGIKGEVGVGVSKVEKTSTSGLVDTYTITLTNGNTSTFTVTNGKDGVSVVSISKTATDGVYDIFTIDYSNGTTSDFRIKQGRDGIDGTNGKDGTNGTNGKDGVSIVSASLVKLGTNGND